MDSLDFVPAMVLHGSHASPGQKEGGLGLLDLLVDGVHIAREIAFSSDSATISSRRVLAIRIHLFSIAGALENVIEYFKVCMQNAGQ